MSDGGRKGRTERGREGSRVVGREARSEGGSVSEVSVT